MVRVLMVEDSLTDRLLLREILAGDPEIQVVGEAKDGKEAVALTQKLRPDLVTMDIRMPVMDGLAATKEIMIVAPTPIVIITGSLAGPETEVAIHALRAGAVCVLHKPSGPLAPDFDETAQKIRSTVKSMAQVKVVRHWPEGRRPALPMPKAGQATRRQVVAIATSTGGPAALQQLLSGLPATFPVPILVVQHITVGFTPGLVSWLNTVCGLQVKVAQHGDKLLPHTVYLAPDDRHLGLGDRGTIAISNAPPVGGFRPSGTFLFESVARTCGAASVAVILTGMGEDGVAGLRAVRQAGGAILAQDEASSVVFGMPGSAIAQGLADVVLPLEAIAGRLVELVVSSQ
jgi:two-component system chemotaxis response regulator CheB